MGLDKEEEINFKKRKSLGWGGGGHRVIRAR